MDTLLGFEACYIGLGCCRNKGHKVPNSTGRFFPFIRKNSSSSDKSGISLNNSRHQITCNNSNTHSLTVGNADSTSSRIELECDNGNLGTIPGCYPSKSHILKCTQVRPLARRIDNLLMCLFLKHRPAKHDEEAICLILQYYLSDCAAPVIAHGTLSPSGSASIVNMATYTLSCGSGYTVSGTATMTCVNGVLDQAPICAKGMSRAVKLLSFVSSAAMLKMKN